ncbi:cyclin-like protein, partial [Coprinellus micaceus]
AHRRCAHHPHPQCPRRSSHQTQQAPASKQDPFYGHEVIARMCARFITHLFACPEYPPATTHSQAKLPHFIAYALHRTKLHPSVTFAALILLQRLKARFPTARGSSGHRLFISAFMIASKVICDDTYSNKSWGIVAQGMFSLREINQMEREMCNYLDWELTVDNPILSNFEKLVTKDFSQDRSSFPNYPLVIVSKRAARAAASTTATPVPEPSVTTTAIPNFGQHRRPSSASQPNPPPPLQQNHTPHRSSSSASTANTPSPSHSNTTSPATPASPQTPIGLENNSARIHGVDASPFFTFVDEAPQVHPLKGQMFAFAVPSKF